MGSVQTVCPKCGAKVLPTDHTCMRCGADVRALWKAGADAGGEAADVAKAQPQGGAAGTPGPPVVSPTYTSVQCPYCKRQLPLDPPRTAGDRVTCGVCGRQLTLAHPPRVGAPGNAVGRKVVLYTCGGCAVLFVLALVIAGVSDMAHNHAKQTADTPQRLAESIISQSDAMVSADAGDGGITVRFRIDPWALTAGTARSVFPYNVKRLVPEMLDRFPDAQWVRVNATGELTDVRGNKSREVVMSAGFTRANASTIQWASVLDENLPKVADEWWVHPAMLK